MRRLIFPTMLLAAVFACQNYDFHHITPTPVTVVNFDASINAAPGTPYIMIVEDMSGSMCEPIAADGGITDSGIGAGDCAANLQTGSKIGLVATNISKVLSQLPSSNPDGGNPYYLGLTTFPAADGGNALVQGCVPPSGPQVPIDIAYKTIPGIESFYGGAINIIGGGTPTAEALAAAGTFFPQVSGNTTKYILLLTDGLPNCNLLHPCVVDSTQYLWSDGVDHGCMSPSASAVQRSLPAGTFPPDDGGECACSYGSCPNPTGAGANNQCCFADPSVSAPGALLYEVASAQCLDDVHTISVTTDLYNSGIQTYVIGMGQDFTDFSLLDAIAAAGQGQPGNPMIKHIQADDETTLYNAINGLLSQFVSSCSYTLNAPVADPRLIEVILDGNTLTLGVGFSYSDGAGDGGSGGIPTVTLLGASCALVENGMSHSLSIQALGSGN